MIQQLNELVEFCKTRGRPAFSLWEAEDLLAHLGAHAVYGTLVWVRSPMTMQICGVGTVWPCSAEWLRYQEEHPFDGQPPNWTETDAAYLGDWVATEPGALRSMVTALVRRFEKQMAGRRMFAHRHGRLVEVSRREIWRIVMK